MTFINLAIFLAILGFYFLPTIIAGIRKTDHQNAIGAVNLLLGWTIVGWLAALIWAVVEKPEPPATQSQKRSIFSEPFYK